MLMILAHDAVSPLLEKARPLLPPSLALTVLQVREGGWQMADGSPYPHKVAFEASDSVLALPLNVEGSLWGALLAESQNAAIESQHRLILELLAEQIALKVNLQRAQENLDTTGEALQSAWQELAIHHEVSKLATSGTSWVQVLPDMAAHLAALFDADACAITLWDGVAERPQRLAAWGIDQEAFLNATHRPAFKSPSLTARVVTSQQPIFVTHHEQPAPTPLIEEFGAKTMVALPLIARGRAIGAAFLMNLYSENPFSPEIVAVATPSLNQMALTIDNQLLFSDTQDRLQQTKALLDIAVIAATSQNLTQMLRQVLERIRQLLSIRAGAVLFYDETNQTLQYRSGYGGFGFGEAHRYTRFSVMENIFIAKALTSGQPYYLNSMEELDQRLLHVAEDVGLENVLVAPLRVQDYFVGVVVVAGKQGDFTDADAGLLMAVASHIAAALRNNQLLDNTRERLRETEALRRIAAITSATLDLSELLMGAVHETAHLFGVEGALLLMPNNAERALVPHYPSLFGVVREWPPFAYPMEGGGHQIEVFQTGTVYLSNEPTSSRFMPRRSILTVPLSSRQQTLGVMSLINRTDGDFNPNHADLAVAIASQIAISIENARLFQRERERADLMSLINRINQELTAVLDMPGLMRRVVDNVHDLLGYDAVHIYLLDETRQFLTTQASAANNTQHLDATGVMFPANQGIAGRALRTGQVQIVGDIQKDPETHHDTNLMGLHACLIVPLKHFDNIYGILVILSAEENTFTEMQATAMENLAAQISISLDNARLYNQAQRRLLEQGIVHQIGQDLTAILNYNDLVLAVARHMARAIDTTACIVAAYNPVNRTVRIEADYRLPGNEAREFPLRVGAVYRLDNLSGIKRAILTRRPVTAYLDDATGGEDHLQDLRELNLMSELIVPMVLGERVIGLVMWSEQRRNRRFSLDDERLAQTLVSQAAIALVNARLFRESEQRAREQALLRQVALSLAASNNTDELVTHFVEEVRAAVLANNTLVSLFNRRGELVMRAASLETLPIDSMILRQHPDLSAYPPLWEALNEGESIIYAPNLSALENPQEALKALVGERVGAVVLTPISHRGRLIGVAEVAFDMPDSAFDASAIQLLESLGNQAAIAIDNVRLSRREQRRLRQMERLQKSNRLIASELELGTLLQVVVREAASIFDASAVAVFLPDDLDLNYMVRAGENLSDDFIAHYRWAIPEQEDRELTFVEHLISDAPPRLAELIESEGLWSGLRAPLLKADKRFGYLDLYSREGARFYSDEEREIVRLFVNQVAVALDNVQLFANLQQHTLELTEANRLKSQFLANISHELRTPMNSILGFSETILSGLYGDLNEKQTSRMERILRNGRNLLALIDDLLDISKIDAGRMELQIAPVSLKDEIQAAIQAIESQAQGKGLYLQLEMDAALPPVMADTLRLRQVINNLVGNAVKFTNSGGVTLTANLRNEVILSPQPGQKASQEVVWVSVTDTGIGISLEDQLVIFDEFRQADGSTTREYGGTGLGLAICKRLIEMMGGRIWVDSEQGQGSTFTFVLPTQRND